MTDKQKLIIIKLMLSTMVILVISILLWNYLGWRICRLFAYEVGNYELLISEEASEQDSLKQFEDVVIQKEGINATYPRILTGGSAVMLEEWNWIIKEDFDKIMQIYSFQPFPGPTPPSTNVVPILLTVSYEVKSNTEAWLSLLYRANYSSIYSAHPSNLVYTTNIDKRGSRRLRLSDIINLNDAFVKEFRTWKLKSKPEDTKEVQEAIYDYINHISDEELLAGFQSADQIGSNNPWGIYSYLTEDSIGISIEVPNYAGDHAEFEQAFTHLDQYLKPEFSKLASPSPGQ